MGLRIEVLGPLRVSGTEASLSRNSHRRLLSILVLAGGHRIEAQRLIDMLWADDPASGTKAALQTHISALRRLLSREVIITEGHGYRLDLDQVLLDVNEFVDAANKAKAALNRGDLEGVVETARAGLRLWRGDPFPDLDGDDFAHPERVRLQELNAEMWENWSTAMVRLGRPADAVAELERLVLEYPLRERLWLNLVTGLYRQGRHAEALRMCGSHRDALAEIGLEPGPELQRLEEKVLLHEMESDDAPSNLPPELDRFFGRDRELADLAELLEDNRLVTLTGVGGSGKTRLSVRLAESVLDRFPDGCWFVALADLDDRDLVAAKVADTLGLGLDPDDPVGSLGASLRHDALLLILDNCEHVLAGAAETVRELLKSAGGLRVLATSREPLHLPGEVMYDVPPMATPPDWAPTEDLGVFEAISLFEDRARLADPSFAARPVDRLEIAAICRRLDGLPLAIELAAAQLRSLDLTTIDRLLEERLRLLAAPGKERTARHHTLETAIAWSNDLLDPSERQLLATLSIFRGGFDLEMVEAVATPSLRTEVVGIVQQLVDKSLVTRVRQPEGRLRLLETVRAFADNRLRGEDRDEVKRRHLDWCVDFVTDVENRVHGEARNELIARLRLENENLQTGLDSAKEIGDDRASSLIAGALALHWLDMTDPDRSRSLLGFALSHGEPDPLREGVLRSRLGSACFSLGDGEGTWREGQKSVELVSQLEPSPAKSRVLARMAQACLLLVDRDPRLALSYAEEAAAVATETLDRATEIHSQIVLGRALTWNGDPDGGWQALQNAVRLADEHERSDFVLDVYDKVFDPLYLDPERRRHQPTVIAERVRARLTEGTWHHSLEWLPYVYMQNGNWETAEEMIERLGQSRVGAYVRTSRLISQAALRWMQGHLEAADESLTELEKMGVNPRWYHDYYPLRADIATDRGDLRAAREFAADYLAFDVDRSEMANKLGVLDPLVRGEVQAALAADDSRVAKTHNDHARTQVQMMEDILEKYPPPTEGSLAMETPLTHLALARAELSRLEGSSAALWEEAVRRADYVYFRLYARIRLAESMLGEGYREGGLTQLRTLADESRSLGATALYQLTSTLLTGSPLT